MMDGHARSASSGDLINELTVENDFLRAQVQDLNAQILELKAEIASLRTSATSHWARPPAQAHDVPSYNTLALPAAVESLAVMQKHFRHQGTLRQWCDQDLSSHWCAKPTDFTAPRQDAAGTPSIKPASVKAIWPGARLTTALSPEHTLPVQSSQRTDTSVCLYRGVRFASKNYSSTY